MKDRILEFISELRESGLTPSPAETLDALAAVRVVGADKTSVRESLSCTLVKDEADRPAFLTAFDRYFRVPALKNKIRDTRRSEVGEGIAGLAEGETSMGRRSKPPEAPNRSIDEPIKPTAEKKSPRFPDIPRQANLLARTKSLQGHPLEKVSTLDQEDCHLLAEYLAETLRAHLSRRQQRSKRGRIDLRRTIRECPRFGGVPLHPRLRQRRPGRLRLFVLCDCSHSMRAASEFVLALLRPVPEFFREVHTFGFVDDPVEVSIENGHLVPHAPLDLYARSDLGQTLVRLWHRHSHFLTRNTIFLIFADGRNNRRPARADILARIATTVRTVVWLNPEPRTLWQTGDSAMASYLPHCKRTLCAGTAAELAISLRQSLSR